MAHFDKDRRCPHCWWMDALSVMHRYVCNCTHHHADHIFAGPCTLCDCDHYSQTRKLKPGHVLDPKEKVQEVVITNV